MEVTLALENGTMQIPEDEKAQTIAFDRYIIKLPLSLPARAPNFKKRGTMNMAELMDRAREAGLDTPNGRAYHTEFHKRLVLPIGCLFLSLLGMPLGLQAGPGRRAIGIPFGLIFYITYYVMFTMSRNLANSGGLPVPLIMWIPNTLFFLLAVILINRAAHEKPLVTPFVQSIFDRMINALVVWSKGLYQWLRSDIFSSRRLPDEVDAARNKILRGNARNRIFHFPECDYYYAQNCSVEFKNSHVALKAGFEPCMFCRTILADKQKQEQLPDESRSA
jgi:lipopolysaccharide export system permease protein